MENYKQKTQISTFSQIISKATELRHVMPQFWYILILILFYEFGNQTNQSSNQHLLKALVKLM
jgi:hypothetical protein